MRYEGKRGKIENLVLDIVGRVSGEDDLSKLDYQAKLRDKLDIDSMDFLDVIMELRKRKKIEVPKEDYSRLATLDGCIDYLMEKHEERFS